MEIKNNQNKHATIKEIAKRANVSIATVSRVLNNKKIVKNEKKQKILKIISDLNYIPNPAARILAKKQYYKIAVVVPNIISPSLMEIVKGISEVLFKNNIDMILLNSSENSNKEKKIFFSLFDKLIEGVIFVAQCGEDLDFSQLAKRMPIATIKRAENINLINRFEIDNYDAMKKIVKYLYDSGHKKIAHISGLSYSYNSKIITKSLEFSLKNKKMLLIKKYFCNTSFSLKGGADGYNYLMNQGNDFTAVVCSSDLIAIGAASEAMKKNQIFDNNCIFIGYDGIKDVEYFYPNIITLDYPGYKMGNLAAKAIVEKIKNGNKILNKKNIFKTNLIIK